jgi:hypothetical protein
MNIRQRLANALFGDLLRAQMAEAVKVVDDAAGGPRFWTPLTSAATTALDLPWAEQRQQLDDCLAEWRANPLAFRITQLMSDFVVGAGIHVKSRRPEVQAFLERFWRHPQNRLDERLPRWCDELTRAGELFLVLSRNPGDRISYVREIPASLIDRVETDPEDYEAEFAYHQVTSDPEGRVWLSPRCVDPADDQVMLHFSVNRPVGATRGLPDLLPILKWLWRYQDWVEDRARLNKYRSAFLWHCQVNSPAPGELERKRAQYSRTPSPGSLLITDQNESWRAVQPQIAADEAEPDGKALRLMIAAGAGVPLHFLGEGESATKATAAEMGQPTYRHYQARQVAFGALLLAVARTAIQRALVLPAGDDDFGLSYQVEDLTREDNESLARAAAQVVGALGQMRERGWIDDEHAAALALKFAGELLPPEELAGMMEKGDHTTKNTKGAKRESVSP